MNVELDGKALEQYKKGLEYIYPQMRGKWALCVRKRNYGSYRGADVDIALEFMRCVHEKQGLWGIYLASKKKYEFFDLCFGDVVNMVTKFSREGVEFYSWVLGHVYAKFPSLREEKYLCNVFRKNSEYEKEISTINENENLM